MQAEGKAITGYSESFGDLVGYQQSGTYLSGTGRIDITNYFTAADGVNSSLYSYQKSVGYQIGPSGTFVPTESWTYTDGGVAGDGVWNIASDTTYPDASDSSVTRTTTYLYNAWWQVGGVDTAQPKQVTTTLPAIGTGENGSGSANTTQTYYDSAGRVVWSVDGGGYIDYFEYDPLTGAKTKEVDDVDPTTITTAAVAGPTRSGSLPTALNLTTTMVVDSQGRNTKVTDPNGNVTYTVYDDTTADGDPRKVITYTGWNATTHQPTGPVYATIDDPATGTKDTISYTYTGTGGLPVDGSGVPTGAEWNSTNKANIVIQSLVRQKRNVSDQVVEEDTYTNLTSLTYDPTATGWATLGVAGTNYLSTKYKYDGGARLYQTTTPDGTITQSVFDARGLVLSTWKGTNNTAATETDPTGGGASGNNMVEIASYTYDADGNRLTSKSYASTPSTSSNTNALVLNEANCVSGAQYLQVSGSGGTRKIGSDTGMLGVRVQGNGNNWLELLVLGETDTVNHTMDLRGYKLNWEFNKSDDSSYGSGTITFKNNPAFAAVKKGTLITISEFQKISYNPSVDSTDTTGGLNNGGHLRWAGIDGYGVNHAYVSGKTIANGTLIDLSTGAQNSTYHKHFWAGDTSAEGTLGARMEEDGDGNPYAESDYFTFTGTTTSSGDTLYIGADTDAGLFTANNDDWGMQVMDSSGAVVTNWVGEAESGYGGGGVGDDEMLKLQQPASNTSGYATYPFAGNYSNALMADGKESTMGVANRWSAGAYTQDLESLLTSPTFTTVYSYDSRDRLTDTRTPDQIATKYTYDNLDEQTEADTYADSNTNFTIDSGEAISQTATSYDDQGRVYRSTVTTPDGSQSTNMWYDARGNVVKTSTDGQPTTKTTYDGAGRATDVYTTDATGDSTYADAFNVTGDTVLKQTDTTYDADGNTILTSDRERFHDATATGTLGDPSSSGTTPKARVYYQAAYYDAANRDVADVNVGTNGGSTYTRPGTVPMRSDDVLVTSYAYDAAGRLFSTTDPRGLVSATDYDLAGRTIKTIADYVDGTPSNDDDQTTEFAYDTGGHLSSQTADMPSGASQTTAYLYGVTTAQGSKIDENDLLRTIEYPNPSTGAASTSASGQESYTYNALGQMLTKTDRNGTTHTYGYDTADRQTSDTVSTLGAGVDGAVRRINTAYDSHGNPYLLTSYADVVGGTVVNQIKRTYNDEGQITAEYQATGGAVNTATTPKVQYTYSGLSSGSRLTGMTYPNGREIDYNYASGLDDAVGRLSSISDSSGTLEAYAYLGMDIVVDRMHPQTGVDQSYIKAAGESTGDAGDQYTGLDRFDRVTNQKWVNASGTVVDQNTYTYDRDGNVLTKSNPLDTALSEAYTYDGLNRLTSDTKAGSADQSWSLDALGNSSSVTTGGTTVSRTNNSQNQLTTIGSSTLAYDGNGNTTTDEQGRTLVYDAWNRLVEAKSGSTSLIRYAYDGLNRRIKVGTTDVYYDTNWQVVEERNASGQTTNQYTWSPVYVDAMIERDRDTDNDGSLDERLYFTQDANWDVTAVMDSSGVMQARYDYTAYGTRMVLNPITYVGMADLLDQRQGYQGGTFDAVLPTLILFRNRLYNTVTQRWEQEDPAGNIDGPNLYRPFESNPVNRVDPLGLWGENGHYWATYMAAIAAGMSPSDAMAFAGYSQLPDENGEYDAIQNAEDFFGNTIPAPAYDNNAIKYNADINKLLHSLHGGDAKPRQDCLKSMLNDPTLAPWEKGFVNHALGDSYAHIYTDRNGNLKAFDFPFGHLTEGHTPDTIAGNHAAFDNYVSALYAGLGGTDPAKLQALLNSTSNIQALPWYDFLDNQSNYENGILRGIAEGQYGHPTQPPGVPFRPSAGLINPSPEDVQKLMDKIAKHCGCSS